MSLLVTVFRGVLLLAVCISQFLLFLQNKHGRMPFPYFLKTN
ncbi:putative membrane protein [Janthinobacterium agaricidamnosum NBRC 102515 = DSM 9628]|uniref:Putative membrane protein n=1 Tax=Janthinobacterium agaricidamnosum NBRC 102515 = DSM 9628 TaxID=1349767 RepID=W0V5M2_9BURK|nr:putative membrane protein [Janthinobacterium agaricidamnosum NBRC 102515 = DSM 9628]